MSETNPTSRVPTVLLTLTAIVLGGVAFGGTAFAAAPSLLELTIPSLGLAPGEPSYNAAADLGDFELPLINVTNPSAERYVMVRIVAWSAEKGQSRWFLVSLEPRGSSTLSLEGAARFAHLSFVGKEEFSVELLSATADLRRDVPVFRNGGVATKSVACQGTWTLTCSNAACSGLGPFSAAGRVEDGDQVYWNLNTPTGPWTTVGDQGITAYWAKQVAGPCPRSVWNSLSHRYDVDTGG